MLHLVRHGLPRPEPDRPAHEWPLSPAARAGLQALRASGVLPAEAAWFSSPEPKAAETASALARRSVPVCDGLREALRSPHGFDERSGFEDAVRRSFAAPAHSVHPGWEPLTRTRARVVAVVRTLLAAHPGPELVLVGHGTAWTLLVGALTDSPPDVAAWAAMRMPDHTAIDVAAREVVWAWGSWADPRT